MLRVKVPITFQEVVTHTERGVRLGASLTGTGTRRLDVINARIGAGLTGGEPFPMIHAESS